ncbi:hypothetical protein L3Q82_012216 [Scortum barcoo]|uniref:Uncharacterized protein n=1 Tax=Scortum barcoo TaxID=214431 RepID=A0ACB8W260_9TELE|nr:hypothetical protein L3Q82_012216 [Scortum barcoo]
MKCCSGSWKIVSPLGKLSGRQAASHRCSDTFVSHRQQVQMILNKKDEELSLVFNLRVDDFEYVVFVTSGTLKCFGCGKEEHLVRACPEKSSSVRKAQSEETQSQTEQDAEETTETQKSQENTETEREAVVSQKTARQDTAEKTVKDTDRLNTEGHLMGGKDLFKPPSLRGNSRPSAVSLRLRKEQLIRAEAGSRSRTSQKLSPAWRRRRRKACHDEDSQSQTDSQPSVKTQQGQSYEHKKKDEQSRFIHALRSDKGQLLTEAGEIRQKSGPVLRSALSDFTFLAPGGASDPRGPAGRAGQQQTWALPETGLSQDQPRLHDAETLASRSNRHTRNILNAWTTKLTTDELEMLQDYASGAETPDEGDLFPELGLEVDQSELTGPLLVSQRANMHMWDRSNSIYKSRKKHIEDASGDKLLPMFVSLVKARVRVDFWFYSLMNNVKEFLSQWCFNKAVCSVVDGELSFNPEFL